MLISKDPLSSEILTYTHQAFKSLTRAKNLSIDPLTTLLPSSPNLLLRYLLFPLTSSHNSLLNQQPIYLNSYCAFIYSPSLRNNLSAAYFSNFPYLEQFHLSAQNKARYHLANEYTLFFKTELAFHFLKVIFKGQTNNLNLYIWLSAHQSSLKENEALTQQKQPTFL